MYSWKAEKKKQSEITNQKEIHCDCKTEASIGCETLKDLVKVIEKEDKKEDKKEKKEVKEQLEGKKKEKEMNELIREKEST